MSEKRLIGARESSAKRQRLIEEFGVEFEQLPPLAKIEFMTLTEPEDILAVCSVSQSFRAFCNNDQETTTFWKEQIRKLGAPVPAAARLRDLFPSAATWFQAWLEQKALRGAAVDAFERAIDLYYPNSRKFSYTRETQVGPLSEGRDKVLASVIEWTTNRNDVLRLLSAGAVPWVRFQAIIGRDRSRPYFNIFIQPSYEGGQRVWKWADEIYESFQDDEPAVENQGTTNNLEAYANETIRYLPTFLLGHENEPFEKR